MKFVFLGLDNILKNARTKDTPKYNYHDVEDNMNIFNKHVSSS